MKTLLFCLLMMGCSTFPRICIGSVVPNTLSCVKAPADASFVCPDDFIVDEKTHTVVCRSFVVPRAWER